MVLQAPGREIVFDAPSGEIVIDLIGLHRAAIVERGEFFHVLGVEIADAPVADFARAQQRGETFHGFGKRRAAAPMQEIKIEPVGAEPLQAALAGGDHAAPRGILRQHLADQEHFVAPSRDGFAGRFFGAAARIHLRRVDQVHAEIEPEFERGDFVFAAARGVAHHPGAQPEHGHGIAGEGVEDQEIEGLAAISNIEGGCQRLPLAMAATLACGWLGMRDHLQPSDPTEDSAWNVSHELPRHLEDAIEVMRVCEPMKDVLGDTFVDAFCAVKELEYATYNRVISSWEREHLLLLV